MSSFQRMCSRREAVIGERVLRHYDFLRRLARTTSEKKRTQMLHSATEEELLSLVEIALNVLKSHFFISHKQKEKLVPHATAVRKLGSARTAKGARKALLIGNGAAVSPLLTPVLAVAGRALKNGS